MDTVLKGINVVSLAINIPGPVAAAELRDMGASVCKVEPPQGDPLAHFSRTWYDQLCNDMDVLTLDLKSDHGMAELKARLNTADLLLTATRPAALERLGLGPTHLRNQFPNLCHVGITGYPHPNENEAGHDLTYQATIGSLQPPELPRVLLADMAGAQDTVSAALALLFARERTGTASHTWVALATAAERFATTLREGITTPGGILGGGLPTYTIYATRDGHIALAALEPHFHQRLLDALDTTSVTQEQLAAHFRRGTNDTWKNWAKTHGIPLAALPNDR